MSLVNLLPDDYVARQAQRRANLLCSVLFGVVMAGVVGAALVSEHGYARTREVREQVNQSYADAAKLLEQLQTLEVKKKKLLGKASGTTNLLERVPRSYLLATVTNALPEGGSLTKFALTGKREMSVTLVKNPKTRFGVMASKRSGGGGGDGSRVWTLTVTGLAGTDVEVAAFIAAMARCPLMQTVELVYSQEKEVNETVAREFQVTMRLKPGADVLTTPPAQAREMALTDAFGTSELAGGAQ